MRMTRRIAAYLFLLMTIVVSGCLHNGGGDTRLYGNWKMLSAECQNTTDVTAGKEGTWFWAFQGTTFRMVYTSGPASMTETYGNYRLEDNTLFLDFAERTPMLGLAQQSELQVLEIKDNRLRFLYHPDDGSAIIYELKKW